MDSDTDDASDTCIPLTRSARRSNQCRVRILTEREVHDVLNCTGRGLNRFYSHFALTPDSPSWPSWIFVSLYSLGLAPAVLIDTHHTQTHRAQTYSIQDSPEVAPRPTRTSARSRKTALETNQAAARTTTSPSPLTFSPCQTAIWTSYTSHQKHRLSILVTPITAKCHASRYQARYGTRYITLPRSLKRAVRRAVPASSPSPRLRLLFRGDRVYL